MNSKPFIELSAIAGKIAIEHTKLHPLAKLSINWTIDQVAEYLKKECSSDIEKICSDAKHFDIDKVVVIPLGICNEIDIVAIRAYGIQSEEFIKAIGMQIIPDNTQNNLLVKIGEIEQKLGIVIYQKKN